MKQNNWGKKANIERKYFNLKNQINIKFIYVYLLESNFLKDELNKRAKMMIFFLVPDSKFKIKLLFFQNFTVDFQIFLF